ncbi:flavin reductase family protein [Pseudonocardia kongjuensis]|uniref:Flavin reductase family protein n=2 Tax=Pseudonocardia kongjuensis TaxID=102227 RepID=A0ABN1XK08_9PSEU
MDRNQSTAADVVDPAAFRRAFRGHPSGVAIITAGGPDGPVGVTASSVASVSTRPPALSFSIAENSRLAVPIRHRRSLLVHLLDSRDADLGARFAEPGASRFGQETRWRLTDRGEPHLLDVGTVLRCTVHRTLDVGDALLVGALVVGMLGPGHDGDRLAYVERRYHSIPAGSGA